MTGFLFAAMPPLPRPTPGPEPWPASVWERFGWMVWLVVTMLLITLTTWRVVRSRRDRQGARVLEKRRPGPSGDSIADWSDRVRAALVTRFGTSWEARTTEEIAGAVELDEALGSGPHRALAEFLRAADAVRFGGRSAPEWDWKTWAQQFVLSGGLGPPSAFEGL